MSLVNKKGVDISSNNGDVSIQIIKSAGYNFVMIRCGYGSDIPQQDDTQFAANVRKCEAAGMPWGVYLFSYALNASEAKSEVEHVDRLLKAQKAKGYRPTLPVALDVEWTEYHEKNGGWNAKTLTTVATTFLDEIKKRGYYPMIYTGYDELDNMLSAHIRNDFDCWFAQWYTKPSSYKYKRLCIWQYGGETNYIESNSISGVGVIDKDLCYKDYPTIIKNGGYNGWPKPSTGMKICRTKLRMYSNCQYAFWVSGAKNPKWSTSNKNISKIDNNGVLTATASGTTTVTVTDGNKSAKCAVTVDNGRTTGISKSKITISKGQRSQLSTKVKNVTWFSSNTNVATVDKKGKVIGVGLGYATIHAYDTKGSSTCLVKVITPPAKKSGTTETQLRQKVCNTINGWVGAKEGDSVQAEILRIYNNQKNLPYGYKMQTHDAWCAATVSAAWLKVGIASYICTDCNCGGFRDKAIKLGIWVENDAYKPKLGDAIIYNWSDDGVGDNKGSADHIGLVTAVNGNSFTVTEGNTGNGVVGKRAMHVNGRYIRGFIAPNYAAISKKIG